MLLKTAMKSDREAAPLLIPFGWCPSLNDLRGHALTFPLESFIKDTEDELLPRVQVVLYKEDLEPSPSSTGLMNFLSRSRISVRLGSTG